MTRVKSIIIAIGAWAASGSIAIMLAAVMGLARGAQAADHPANREGENQLRMQAS